ncbi:hypothetical protein V502_00463 [Pseudogymnoascus sp. VKM F-4520 (FW-2644)]|nr:hypothetical protein V502_00463 [Pseudogymnoascus sp. VKM F-4520 (FW-2644)]
MAGRPKKYINAREAAAAKLARDRIYSQQRRRHQQSSTQNTQFILYNPTQQDAPPLTSLATGIRSNLDLPTTDDTQQISQQGIVMSPWQQPQQLQAVPAPIPQTEEREVEEVVQSLNVQEEVDEEREAAIILQTLQQEGEEKTEKELSNSSATAKATLKAITTTTKATVEGMASTTIEKDTAIRQPSVHNEDEMSWNVQGDEESEIQSQILSEMSQRLQTETIKSIVYAQATISPQGSGQKRKRQSLPLIPKQAAITNWLQEMPSTPPQGLTTPITINSSSIPSSGASASASISSQSYAQLIIDPTTPLVSWGSHIKDGEPPPPMAVQVARQLWQFHGCTEEQHQVQEEEHSQAHQQPGSPRDSCCSLPQITTLLTGADTNRGPSTSVPDVLSQHRLAKRGEHETGGLNWQAMFEGNRSASASPLPTQRPWGLCLDAHHSYSQQKAAPQTSFDVDSLCAFPTSLAVARQGLNWFPQQYQPLNLSNSVHLGLQVPALNKKGSQVQEWQPLHQIRHVCFGEVIGMPGLLLYVMFPQYNFIRDLSRSGGSGAGATKKDKTITLIRREDEVMLIDEIILPAVYKVVQSANILQHYPTSAATIKANALAGGKERYVKVPHSREQFLSYVIKPEHLDAIWQGMRQRISGTPRFACFQQLTLFLNQKNSKVNYISPGLQGALGEWRAHWATATNAEFLNKEQVYIDVGKQVTSPSTKLPGQHDEASAAETFLYRRCCLESFIKRWKAMASDSATASNSASAPTKSMFTCVPYMWATLRDASSQTVAATPSSQAFQDGYVYSQFYNVVKAPFDAAKVYIFNNDSLESIALDPAYVRSLYKAGGATAFSQKACLTSYLYSKTRAHVNLADCKSKSYGIREEHRLSLSMVDEILCLWQSWEEAPLPEQVSELAPAPAPYYVIPTADVFAFIRAQLNKYCLLFEQVLAWTNKTHSLPEFIMMVVALRALRFSYGSAQLSRELLLYKDQWQRIQDDKPVIIEGLGMAESIAAHGIGWFLPKINWQTLRVRPPHGDRLLAGNMLIHRQYQRRWRAVRDLRDVYIRLGQANEWFIQHHIADYDGAGAPSGRYKKRVVERVEAWLGFLHGLNLNQFDHDVATVMTRSHKAHPELAQDYGVARLSRLSFCLAGMGKLYLVDGSQSPPHSIMGNKARFTTGSSLINFLFDYDDGEVRGSWESMTYRLIYQRTCEMVEQRLGEEWRRRWQSEHKNLLQLTHWILPHANSTTFLNLTKTNQSKGLAGRTSWFSVVYEESAYYTKTEVVGWPEGRPRKLGYIMKRAQQLSTSAKMSRGAASAPAPALAPQPYKWEIAKLQAALKSQCLYPHGIEAGFILGKEQDGTTIVPRWEHGLPPQLAICDEIWGKTLDELEEIFASKVMKGSASANAS